ncbi:MAG: plasmid pRiA4b ORF-3 family protein [Spirochaetaceae bacterium]|jgi:hypothetical protein|nr:plasmid pRiA4b ORF-3 family protein [Spirochaetaceae bacterium]
MTQNQEDALYEFLENATGPFSIDNIVSFVRMAGSRKQSPRLAQEITALINSRNIAFRLGDRRWISRRGCFESARFAISPTRIELLNGILIPGHRCVPFANPILMPQELSFFWKGAPVPITTTEGPPEELYPYYAIYGEEYAPQYVARDNPENESAYNEDPFDDPLEVSIHTLDMRSIYRETGFVPGDRFVVSCRDWRAGSFDLEKAGKDEWPPEDLYGWFEAAEAGFAGSFEYLGPGVSTDEQIAFAYWYGGERMREVPAWSLEEFLYEKTDQIETVPYGLESRFWRAGREIPDRTSLEGVQTVSDRTYIEETLYRNGVPISEFVIQAYVRDALFRGDTRIPEIVERIVPQAVRLDSRTRSGLADYVSGALDEFKTTYDNAADREMGAVRRRVAELHTAVIELSARLLKDEANTSWLPKHTVVVLSQIQSHAAAILEDLDSDEPPPELELDAMDNSLDSMLDTYEETRDMVEEALQIYRRNAIRLVRADTAASSAGSAAEEQYEEEVWRVIQISLGGVDIWRRLALAGDFRLDELHRVISLLFGWQEGPYRFAVARSFRILQTAPGGEGSLFPARTIGELAGQGTAELRYEHSGSWDVKILFLSGAQKPVNARACCVAGAGLPPPPDVNNPLIYRKMLAAAGRRPPDRGGTCVPYTPKTGGLGYDYGNFNLNECNRLLAAAFPAYKDAPELGGDAASGSPVATGPDPDLNQPPY